MRYIAILSLLLLTFTSTSFAATAPKPHVNHEPVYTPDPKPDADEPPSLAYLRWMRLARINQAILPELSTGRYHYGAFINFDITPKTMQKTMPGEEEDYFVLSSAGVDLAADLSRWWHGQISVAYYESNKGQGDALYNRGLQLDDAYILLADFNEYPWFLQLGRLYLPFGYYDRYAVTPTLVQLLGETRVAAVQMGFMHWNGWSASVYFSQGVVTHTMMKIQGDINTGAMLDYQWLCGPWDVQVGAQYMDNMLHTNAFAQGGWYESNHVLPGVYNVYSNHVPGLAAQGHIGYGGFLVFADYITALRTAHNLVHHYGSLEPEPSDPTYHAKPQAWDVGARYDFTLWDVDFSLDGSYQRSYDAAGLVVFNAKPYHPFPKIRYIIGLNIRIIDEAYIRIQWGHNVLYHLGDCGRQGDNATIRFAARI